MTVIDYDTEFLEDGRTIALISIGMVADDGREYYAVNKRMPKRRIRKSPWLMANVVPSLPRPHGDWIMSMPDRWLFNYLDPCVKAPQVIANEVRDFIQATPDPQLWADFAAYDHVVLAQMFGPMVNLPDGVPMWTNDLRQEAARLGVTELPSLPGATGHNALSDAREVQFRRRWLSRQAAATYGSRPAPYELAARRIREQLGPADGIQPG